MAKAGQHENDGLNPAKPRGHETSRGPNHPDRSQTVTTGTYKKKETYEQQAREGGNTGDQARDGKINPWNDDIRETPQTTGIQQTRARHSDIGSGRSGSDSNRS